MSDLPSEEEQAGLLHELAFLLKSHGFAPFVSAPLLEVRVEHFPDAWRADALGVERIARRLLAYAGLPELNVSVELHAGEPTLHERTMHGSQSTHTGAAAWFAGIEDGCCFFGVDVKQLTTPEVLLGVMAHEIAHAFRRFHELERDERDLEEQLTDLTTVYLGFGVLTTNASYRYRKTGDVRGGYAHTEWSHQSVGYLSPQAMSFVLACAVVTRDHQPSERRRLAGLLETNQRAYFRAACEALDRTELIAALGLPPSNEWPPVAIPQPQAFDTSDDPPPPDVAAEEIRAIRARHKGFPVFRVTKTQATLFTWLGFVVALSVSRLPNEMSSTVAFAVGLGLVIGARMLGKRIKHDRCSEPECEARIPAEATTCPGCTGTIAGRIKRREDRLEARDRLETEL